MEGRDLRLFIVAGEHSGDVLGAKLIAALRQARQGRLQLSGVGGDLMAMEGLQSNFAMSDIAVMGPIAILKRLAPIIQRVYQTVDAAIAFNPDALVIIDAPEFTHAVAKRVRRRRPDIPIVDYVSPTVWAWRPGRARAMRPYVDHLLALLPFEPEVHARLGGPVCTYVGHPLIERLEHIRSLDAGALRTRLGIDADSEVVVALPGSRRSEVGRLLDVFGQALGRLGGQGRKLDVVVPAVSSVRSVVEDGIKGWPARVHLVADEDDKWRAFKLARAALAASGTVTLELAVAGTPMVVAYKVEPVVAPLLRRMIKAPSVVLANLVLGETAFPEYLQEGCTAERLAAALAETIDETPARARQLAALARIPGQLELGRGTPSETAAGIVLEHALRHAGTRADG